MKQITVLTASQAFMYPSDAIRLSYLSLPHVIALIQQTFQFQVAQVTTPPPTFEPVRVTNPPGLVFQLGMASTETGDPVAIRMLAIDSERLVWQIAGAHSERIDDLMRRLETVCTTVPVEDGTQLLGMPRRTEVYSELSFALDVDIHTWYDHDPLLRIIAEALSSQSDKDQFLIPSLFLNPLQGNAQFSGSLQPWHGSRFTFELRQGASLADNIFYSAAPLRTGVHIDLIRHIEQFLATGS